VENSSLNLHPKYCLTNTPGILSGSNLSRVK